jgi:hypothetical protein
VTSSAQVQTETTTTKGEVSKTVQVERGEVVLVQGNDLVVKMEDGSIRHFPNVPDSARVTVDGKSLGIHDLKPGMKLQRTITTTTTPQRVKTVKTVTGRVWYVQPPRSVTLTLEDGTNQTFRIPSGQRFNINGQMVDAFGLRKGMIITATKIVESPEVVVSEQRHTTGTMPPPPPPPPADVPILVATSKPAPAASAAEAAPAAAAPAKLPKTDVEEPPERPTKITLARFPNIVSPEEVVAEMEFALEVSLTQRSLSPNTKIEKGVVTPKGGLGLSLPSKATWIIQVVLSAPAFQLTRETNFSDIELPQGGDSTRALFHMKAKATQIGKTSRVMADFFYNGSYLATAAKDISITGAKSAFETNELAPLAPTNKLAPLAPNDVLPKSTRSETKERKANLSLSGNLPADLTVTVRAKSSVSIMSPHLQPYSCDPKDPTPWLNTQYAKIDGLSTKQRAVLAGIQSGPGSDNQSDFMRGFGRDLYLQFAPPCFKDAFWQLVHILGPQFRTIEVHTEDPSFPWELMRPISADNSVERDFLGLEFAVSRWHINESGPMLDRAAQKERMTRLSVIAPHYSGPQTLDNQQREVSALSKVGGYSQVRGNIAASKVSVRRTHLFFQRQA